MKKIVDFFEFIYYNRFMNGQNNLKELPNQIDVLKRNAITLQYGGYDAKVISTCLLVALSTIYKWFHDYSVSGEESLTSLKRGRKIGNGRILNPSEEEELQNIITNQQPVDFKLNFSGWSRKAVVELVSSKFDKEISVRSIGDYLKRWNFTPQRPIKRSYKRDPEEVYDWIYNRYPAISKRASESGAIIYFADETGIQSERWKITSYSKRGKTPVCDGSGARYNLNVIAAVSNTGAMKFMSYQNSMNCRVFNTFLNKLVKSANGQMVFLIVDNLKVHHGKLVSEWLKDHSGELEIFYLPSYCPELNPEENLNNLMKSELHKLSQPNSLEDLKDKTYRVLTKIQKNRPLVQSLFQKDNVRYAAT